MIQFSVPIDPVAKGRARFSSIHDKRRAYTPQNTRTAEQVMALFAREAMGLNPPLTGVLRVFVTFALRKPRSVKRLHPTTKPDLDNYAKTLDALNGIVWVDDSQVVKMISEKRYAASGERPSIYFHVEEFLSAAENGHKKTTLRGKKGKK
jgi:Holliday junction resolvase RusA-like endonuclease